MALLFDQEVVNEVVTCRAERKRSCRNTFQMETGRELIAALARYNEFKIQDHVSR